MKRTWLVLSWIGATALVSWITFEALALADQGVGGSDLTPVVVATSPEPLPIVVEPVESTPTPTVDSSSTTSAVNDPLDTGAATTPNATTGNTQSSTRTTVAEPATTSTTAAGATTTTSAATTSTSDDSGTTSTTSPTTSTTVAETWTTTTATSAGGFVKVRYKTGVVEYVVGQPAAGYEMQIDQTSPEVRVAFVGDEDEYEIRVRWNDGQLDIDISQKG